MGFLSMAGYNIILRTWLQIWATTVVVVVGSLSLSGAAQQRENEKMIWVPASNPMALCNDFTRAGFFIRRNNNSDNWVVFLESGGLCYNSATCNRRFFVRSVREAFQDMSKSIPDIPLYGQFDPARVWDETIRDGGDPAQIVSPLMTSLQCFENKTNFFPTGLNSSIEGRDILDSNPTNNPLYCGYNHVLIPYCSSDLWLGEETDTTDAVTDGVTECECFDYRTNANPNGCFAFNGTSLNPQFTFRGKSIYQSVIKQLIADYGMAEADRVVLAGSSAGGLGVINHVKWTRSVLNSDTNLMVIFDSAWFINFQDGIGSVFNGDSGVDSHLFEVLKSNAACNGTDQFGYPCCISAHCIFTQRANSGQLQFYPEDIPTFALFSVYDIYLLAPGIRRVAALEIPNYITSGNGGGISNVLNNLRVATEYRGTMRYTLNRVITQVSFLSYYVTQCFQHIYLATSTLWGDGDESIFGSNVLELTRGSTSFSNTISSGRWNTLLLAANGTDGSNRGTILEALTAWMSLTGSGTIRYGDTCQGFHCNPQCPEELLVDELTSNTWHVGVKIFIVVLITGLLTACIIMKVVFKLWLVLLERRQNAYLKSLESDIFLEERSEQFPVCDEESAMSVSCLRLCYSIRVKPKKVKREVDTSIAMVLPDVVDYEDSEVQHHRPLPRVSSNISVHEGLMKEILKGISLYFNPGEMVGIMGPSGCGKTTLLDVLTRRRKQGLLKGELFVNGIPVSEVHDWYVANTGYILQLAAPYYEDLTVRENLTLIAQMKLQNNYTEREKFERIEQVMKVTGLLKIGDTQVVGSSVKSGISCCKRRLLTVAIQLLKLPSVIFLDEPTSDLDTTASLEVLTCLNKLADSNHTVILTIHQPRLEIFHTFHKLVLLSDGWLAYYGVPDKAYESFTSAITSRYLEHSLVIPSLMDHNPADVIMDMLGNPRLRQIITEYCQESTQPRLIENAIKRGRLNVPGSTYLSWLRVHGNKNVLHPAVRRVRMLKPRHDLIQMAALEATVSKRIGIWTVIYLVVMFFAFGFGLGTTYIQENLALLIIPGLCAFSTASSFIMFPAMYTYYRQALEVSDTLRVDGVGSPHVIVLQGFIRFASITFIPVIMSVTALYLLMVSANSYDLLIYSEVVLTSIALNQTWIALLISLICMFPHKVFRISPIVSAVAGFSSGFFIPIGALHWG